MRLTLRVSSGTGTVISQASGDDEAWLVHHSEYGHGNVLSVETDAPGRFVVVQIDDAMEPALCFLKGTAFSFPIPDDDRRPGYSPRAFIGGDHYLHGRVAKPEEIDAYRNLAFNPYDWGGNSTLFPHASANVETRNEAAFAARNAIDGRKANSGHGIWPCTSWGINRDPTASLTVDFGRPVLIDRLVVYLRADFPHDSWWTSAAVTFSNGETERVAFARTAAGQAVTFAPKEVNGMRLHSLIKADDESPFPALTQIEAWGRDKARA